MASRSNRPPRPPRTPAATDDNDLVARVRPKPDEPPNAQMIVGIIGRSARAGYVRVYATPALDEYIEIAGGDVRHSVPMNADRPEFGSFIWVAKDAAIEQVIATTASEQASFLGGDLAAEFLPGARFTNVYVGWTWTFTTLACYLATKVASCFETCTKNWTCRALPGGDPGTCTKNGPATCTK